jgi:hypothetical protein
LKPDESGHNELVEVSNYKGYYIISSEYHIPRVKYICSVLNLTKNLEIKYIETITRNPKQLKLRQSHEQYISEKIELYCKHIQRKN